MQGLTGPQLPPSGQECTQELGLEENKEHRGFLCAPCRVLAYSRREEKEATPGQQAVAVIPEARGILPNVRFPLTWWTGPNSSVFYFSSPEEPMAW